MTKPKTTARTKGKSKTTARTKGKSKATTRTNTKPKASVRTNPKAEISKGASAKLVTGPRPSVQDSSILKTSQAVGHTWDFMPGFVPAGATFKRASIGTRVNSSGVLVDESIDVARFNFTAAGVLEGLLVEPAATNSIRNSTMAGAAAGTPGTPPTNHSWSTSINGLTRQIVGTGEEDGIDYVDVRFSGTPSATSAFGLVADAYGEIEAVAGQVWTGSWYVGLVAGSLINTSLTHYLSERIASLSELASSSALITPANAALGMQRQNLTRTLSNASTVKVTSSLYLPYRSDTAIDCTLRLGLPQMIPASAASSLIKSSGTAGTRAADVLSLALAAGAYSMDIVRLSGVTSLTGVTVSGNSYVVPTDPSPLQRITAWKTG